MKTVLLFGGAGFIGSHVAEKYLGEGYKVVIVDNLSSGKLSNIQGIRSQVEFYECDIRDQDKLRPIFEKHRPQIINFHAAQKSVPYSVENPSYDASINIMGLLNIIMLVKEFPIENFIFVSSGGALARVLGENEKSCECDKEQLLSGYAITKVAGEAYIKMYADIYGYEYTILRYSNVYGPRQVADGECGVVPIFVNNILANKDSLMMTYSDMPRGCVRDYINVEDVAEFNVLAAKNPTNETYNVGSGQGYFILDIFEKLKEVFESETNIEIVGPRTGDIKISVLDTTKASTKLGWETKINFDEGIKRLHKYYMGGSVN